MPFSPKAAADACIARSRRVFDAAQANNLPDDVSEDLYRAALVTCVAAIDTYMHWLVFSRLSAVRYERELPKSLAQTKVPFADLASLADSAISAQQEERKIRPWVQVKNTLQAQLLQETFQSYNQIADAFALAGIKKAWTKIADELSDQPAQLKKKLNRLVHRRNQIVHEGDITRSSRPRDIYFNAVDHAEVSQDIDWVETVIDAMQKVVDSE